MSERMVRKILILTANPKGTILLRLDEEVREIDDGLRRSTYREQFRLVQRWAVRVRDVHRAMLDVGPQIVHFSGHGAGDEGLAFEDETGQVKFVDAEALAGLFELFAEQVECVVLNACYSEVQAVAIARHINYVVGMKQEIGDKAANLFAVGFYDALGAGRSVEFAHKSGCVAIRLAGIPEQLIPILSLKKVDGSQPLPGTMPLVNQAPMSYMPDSPPRHLPRPYQLKGSFKSQKGQNSSLNYLEPKLEDLEEASEELRKKLRRLRKDDFIEADSVTKHRLGQHIEEYEEKLREIDEELESLAEQIDNSKRTRNNNLEQPQNTDFLYRALLKLGYWEQQRLFEEVIITRKHSHGVFLIQGRSKEYGQRWLLNRLASIVPKSLEDKNIDIDLNRIASKTDISAIWGELAGWVGLPEESLPFQIVETIHKLWQWKNVLIVFKNVDESIEENLRDLLDVFWKSLAHRVSEYQAQKNTFKLLMFFLDYQGIVINWNLGFVNAYSSSWQPVVPLGLPDIIPFSDELLRNWIEQQSDHLPENILLDKEGSVRSLMEKKGIPEPTIRKICNLCSCNWFEQEGKWLRL